MILLLFFCLKCAPNNEIGATAAENYHDDELYSFCIIITGVVREKRRLCLSWWKKHYHIHFVLLQYFFIIIFVSFRFLFVIILLYK